MSSRKSQHVMAKSGTLDGFVLQSGKTEIDLNNKNEGKEEGRPVTPRSSTADKVKAIREKQATKDKAEKLKLAAKARDEKEASAKAAKQKIIKECSGQDAGAAAGLNTDEIEKQKLKEKAHAVEKLHEEVKQKEKEALDESLALQQRYAKIKAEEAMNEGLKKIKARFESDNESETSWYTQVERQKEQELLEQEEEEADAPETPPVQEIRKKLDETNIESDGQAKAGKGNETAASKCTPSATSTPAPRRGTTKGKRLPTKNAAKGKGSASDAAKKRKLMTNSSMFAMNKQKGFAFGKDDSPKEKPKLLPQQEIEFLEVLRTGAEMVAKRELVYDDMELAQIKAVSGDLFLTEISLRCKKFAAEMKKNPETEAPTLFKPPTAEELNKAFAEKKRALDDEAEQQKGRKKANDLKNWIAGGSAANSGGKSPTGKSPTWGKLTSEEERKMEEGENGSSASKHEDKPGEQDENDDDVYGSADSASGSDERESEKDSQTTTDSSDSSESDESEEKSEEGSSAADTSGEENADDEKKKEEMPADQLARVMLADEAARKAVATLRAALAADDKGAEEVDEDARLNAAGAIAFAVEMEGKLANAKAALAKTTNAKEGKENSENTSAKKGADEFNVVDRKWDATCFKWTGPDLDLTRIPRISQEDLRSMRKDRARFNKGELKGYAAKGLAVTIISANNGRAKDMIKEYTKKIWALNKDKKFEINKLVAEGGHFGFKHESVNGARALRQWNSKPRMKNCEFEIKLFCKAARTKETAAAEKLKKMAKAQLAAAAVREAKVEKNGKRARSPSTDSGSSDSNSDSDSDSNSDSESSEENTRKETPLGFERVKAIFTKKPTVAATEIITGLMEKNKLAGEMRSGGQWYPEGKHGRSVVLFADGECLNSIADHVKKYSKKSKYSKRQYFRTAGASGKRVALNFNQEDVKRAVKKWNKKNAAKTGTKASASTKGNKEKKKKAKSSKEEKKAKKSSSKAPKPKKKKK